MRLARLRQGENGFDCNPHTSGVDQGTDFDQVRRIWMHLEKPGCHTSPGGVFSGVMAQENCYQLAATLEHIQQAVPILTTYGVDDQINIRNLGIVYRPLADLDGDCTIETVLVWRRKDISPLVQEFLAVAREVLGQWTNIPTGIEEG